MRKLLLLALLLLCGPASAQQNFCPTRPSTDNSNACASTAFVQTAVTGMVTGPGGTSGQVQWNNAGAFGGFTASGDITIVTSTGVVTVSNGAITNAKLASGAAVANIGFTPAHSGANSDITSLTGLSTPLSVAQGGSGTATPSIVAGTNISVTGSWPNQTINNTASTFPFKAWCGLNGTTTVSYGTGCASVTNPSSGKYTISFSSAAASTSYSVLVTVIDLSGTQVTWSTGNKTVNGFDVWILVTGALANAPFDVLVVGP